MARLQQAIDPDRLLTDPADCWAYGYDNSRRHVCPQAVAFPFNTEEVAGLVHACRELGLPLVGRGRGSGTAGAAVPIRRGLVISLERMDRIIEINADDRLAIVEAGVTNGDLQRALEREGFFWPPDPTSADYCSVGGNLACNAAGPRAVKYGTPRDNILGLTAVTGTGDIIRTGVHTTKGVVGYDLTRLMVGSEGTLGIITQATLKITPKPEARRTLRAVYTSMTTAAAAVSRIMAQPVTPCMLEFIDGRAIDMIRDYASVDLPEDAGAMLMIEVDGSLEQLAYSEQAVAEAARGDGLSELRTAASEDERQGLWAARKALSPAQRKIAPKKINEDVVVPVSRMADLIAGLDQLSRQYGIIIVNFGHAGNGNIHVNLLVDPDDPKQMAVVDECLQKVFQLVLDLRGTLSGEHGIGYDKRQFVGLEIEPASLALMKQIKKQFDPDGLLNPGKLFPDVVPD
ncbi:FAD-linked oxidase C-terminal domain-containing protein [Natronospira sp. AB-CW4]|uniref:FAD-linked oxidase C-terminal domain-containing protein n=1 Tax=Natronospira bacteriovora TaxID=3069753 RepID=A0ABU0W7T0_9GAMM|nr:FAD-linked oxidase C-terminal domain-containing protein [Natronospira sp. AB-CW4]MDQ2069520.1 FAD-linked oxidase C-terminal domain-containing protein [Natronospira sp. AB-CW4]